MTRILITGAAGYIGRSMVSWFSNFPNTIVTPLTRNDVDLRDCNSLDNWMNRKEFDVIIHAAAVGGSRLTTDDKSVLEQNLSLFRNIFKYKDRVKKFISFGSGSELFNPKSPYGMSKRIIADSLRENANCHNIRIYAVFDENELPTRFIKSNILRCINNEAMVIHANKFMDFFYMEDLCRLTNYFIQTNSDLPNEIDCSYSNRKTLLEIAHQINHACKKSVDILCSSTGLVDSYVGTSNLPQIEFVGLDAGLVATIDALRQSS
jgi:nucleoside-diphosphate-sugar epimerase